MGLTKSSTGTNLLNSDTIYFKNEKGYTVALAGNPNVGKSTIFNGLTGLHQHTGNWTGKTVENAAGICKYKGINYLLVDIPGTYSLMADSEEEKIARDYISSGKADVTLIILDATCLERNLNLVFQIMNLTDNIVVCVNLLDEAEKKGIKIKNREVDVKKLKIKKIDKEKNSMIVEVTIVEGRNHIIKKLFKELGVEVLKLSRIGYGFLDVKDLKSGEYRKLTIKEIKKLYALAKK